MIAKISTLVNISDFLYKRPLQIGFLSRGKESQDYFLREINSELQNVINAVLQINQKNVVNVLRGFKKPFFGPETLIKTIAKTPFFNGKQKLTVLRHITGALFERAKSAGASAALLKKDLQKELTESPDAERLNCLTEELLMRIEAREKIKKVHLNKLSAPEKKASKTLKQEVINSILYYYSRILGTSSHLKDFLGNGVIGDAKSVQEGGTCWAAAGINALSQSARGREHLSNLIMKKNGITTIYLSEARTVYSFSEEDILKNIRGEKYNKRYKVHLHATGTTLGDGDTTAFMMAVAKYFKSSGKGSSKKDIMWGNSPDRIFRLISSHFGYEATDIKSSNNLTKETYDRFLKEFNSGEVAAVLTTPENFGEVAARQRLGLRPKWEPKTLSAHHAYSVVGADKRFLYLGDSNSPDIIIKLSKEQCTGNGLHLTTLRL